MNKSRSNFSLNIVLIFALFFSLKNLIQAQTKDQIDAILDLELVTNKDPGLTIGIIKNKKLIYQGHRGLANLEYDIPFNQNTVFGLASITKQFTAACIAILEKKKLLSVNDPVKKYIPELKAYGNDIKIKHLLNHTSGIRNHNVLLDLQGFDYKHRGYTNESIQRLMFQQKNVNNKPNEKVLYSNTNYVLLALIIKRVSGKSIDSFAKQELFMPLGMENTFYTNDLEAIIKNRAYPYYKTNNTYKQPKSLTHCIGAGGMGSTIPDMAKWATIFFDDNSSFKYIPSFLSTLDTLSNGSSTKCARGVFVSSYHNYKTVNHGGRDLGMRSYLICIPKLDVAIIVFANSEHINAESISYKILDLFIPKPKKRAEIHKNTAYQYKKTALKALTGYYQELNSDLRMHISIERDTLKAQSSFGNTPVPLVGISKNKFHRIGNKSVVYSFNPTTSNEADLLVEFSGATFYFERINLISKKQVEVNDFIGNYYSEELNVNYHFSNKNGVLTLTYPNNANIPLNSGQKDEFGSGKRTKYSFNRNKKGKVISFYAASEGTVKNILFEKINK